MKKRASVLIVLCLALVLTLGLCACGNKKEDGKETTSQVETTNRETTAAQETTAPVETTAPGYDGPSTEEMTEITSDLVAKLNKLNALASLWVDKDYDTAYVDPESGFTYLYVTDGDFQSFGDIAYFLDNCATWDFSKNHFPGLADPSSETIPAYIFVQAEGYPKGLYVIDGGRGYTKYDPNANMTFDDVQEDYFVAYIPYDYFGETRTLTLEIVNDGEGWKLCGMDEGL